MDVYGTILYLTMQSFYTVIQRIWPTAIILLILSLSFACVRENSSQERARYAQANALDSTFQRVNNDGKVDSYIHERFLHVRCQARTYAKPVGLRVYDNEGDLLFIARDPQCDEANPLEIDMRYAEAGDYQLLVYFDNGSVVEDWVAFR